MSTDQDLRVVTNNVARDIVEGHELSQLERAELDYLNWEAIDKGEESASFVRYNGQIYDLGEFSYDYGILRGSGLPAHLVAWDGYLSESAFSAVVVRYVDNGERAIIGRVFS